jgi:hypothetical protein
MNSSRCTSRLLGLILLHKPAESKGLTSSAQLSFICSKLWASYMTQSANWLTLDTLLLLPPSDWVCSPSINGSLFLLAHHTPHLTRLPTYLQVISYYSTTPVFSGDFLNQRFLSVQTCYAKLSVLTKRRCISILKHLCFLTSLLVSPLLSLSLLVLVG